MYKKTVEILSFHFNDIGEAIFSCEVPGEDNDYILFTERELERFSLTRD